jgi:hypothetical protein
LPVERDVPLSEAIVGRLSFCLSMIFSEKIGFHFSGSYFYFGLVGWQDRGWHLGEPLRRFGRSPRSGSAGASGATNAGRAAAAPRALVPTCQFHQTIARRSLYGFKMAYPAPAPENSCGGAPEWERLPLIVRATTQCARPQRGAISNGSAGARGGTGQRQPRQAPCRPLPYDRERGGANPVTASSQVGRDPRQDRTSLRQRRLPFNHASLLGYFTKSWRKSAIQRPHREPEQTIFFFTRF